MKVWAFNDAVEGKRELVYQSIKNGKSRFGWSWKNEHNLIPEENWTEEHPRQLFLLKIKPGDWIVHINTPVWGRCTAVEVESEYGFDDGINLEDGIDFRHYIGVAPTTIIEFDRRDPNILPTVNLNPRQRYHRIYAKDDFLESLKNIKNNTVLLGQGESKGVFYLKKSTTEHLKKITKLIHKNHKGKELERFLAEVFRRIDGVKEVEENGFGWGSDYGADLIVNIENKLANLNFKEKIIVQVKSYEGEHSDLNAVEQIKTGIKKYNGTAGMIITTAEKTEKLENKILEATEEIGYQIDLMASEDVAKFVIKYAPDLLFNLN